MSVLDDVTTSVGDTREASGKVLAATESVEAATRGLQHRIEDFLDRVAV